MAWTIEFSDRAKRQFERLDATVRKRIKKYLEDRVAPLDDPRLLGKALHGTRNNEWRYRVGDYRLICRIEDSRVVIVVVELGHRSSVYD